MVPVSLLVKADDSTQATKPPVGAYGPHEMGMLWSIAQISGIPELGMY